MQNFRLPFIDTALPSFRYMFLQCSCVQNVASAKPKVTDVGAGMASSNITPGGQYGSKDQQPFSGVHRYASMVSAEEQTSSCAYTWLLQVLHS